MNNDKHDTKLKELFGRMRDEDTASTPSFNSTFPATGRKYMSTVLIWRFASAMALFTLIIAGPFAFHTCSSHKSIQVASQVAPEKWTSITSWEAGTDELLSSPYDGSNDMSTDSLLDIKSFTYND